MTTQTDEQRAHKRRYRIFLFVEALLLILAIFLAFAFFSRPVPEWFVWSLTALFGWHIFAVPICIMYLCGNPVVMTLVPLIDSPESRAFRKELRQRPVLSDEEFYTLYYDGSAIPKELIVRVRRVLGGIDQLLKGAIPSDAIYLIFDELDYADVLWAMGKEFKISFTKIDYPNIDGTFDNLVHQIQLKL